jgi:transcriptional regulator
MGRKSNKNESLPATLDMLILKMLARANLHGYAIAQLIRHLSGDELLIEEGSLYPALQRLELNGWVDGEWGVTPAGRRARIYRLTGEGRKQLAVETQRYRQLTLAVARVMGLE